MTSPYVLPFQITQKQEWSEGPSGDAECISALSEKSATIPLRETS